MPATHPYVPRVSVIFDFDRTLASDTIDALCAAWGLERKEWEQRYCEPLGDGWDGILKRGHALIQCGRDRGEPLSETFFAKAAEHMTIYPGLDRMRERLEETARCVLADMEVELVVLSSGYVEMIKRTAVADIFDRLWAGDFHSDEKTGEAITVKRIIGHPEKALYIESYAKGLDLDSANTPQTQTPEYDPECMWVPFDQIVYVGDGLSDLSSFEFVNSRGGLALAVNEGEDFEQAERQTQGERVENLAPPDYTDGSELMQSLTHAVRSAASRAALRKLGKGE